MSLFDYIFADEIQLKQLRDISKTLKNQQIFEKGRAERLKKEKEKCNETDDDIGLLSLLMMTVIKKLIAKGIITEQELLDELLEIDQLDGLKDGKLDINVLRGSVGLAKYADDNESAEPTVNQEDLPKKKTFLEKMREEESEKKIVIKKESIPKKTKMLGAITKEKSSHSHSTPKRTKTHKSHYRK